MEKFRHFLLSGGVFIVLVLSTVLFAYLGRKNLLEGFSQVSTSVPDSVLFARNIDSLESSIRSYLSTTGIHGLSLAISYNNRLVYAKGFGYADIETKEKVTPDHLFRIASVSKLITAWGIMKLVEEGKLSIDDCAFGQSGILKDFRSSSRKVYDISIEHLLTHSAGWSRRTYGDPMFKTRQIGNSVGKLTPSPDDIIHYVLARRIPFRPGEHYDYSNFGYVVLGQIIEEVSGKSYIEFIREELLFKTRVENLFVGKNYKKEKYDKEVLYYDERKGNVRKAFDRSGKSSVKAPYGANDISSLAAAGGLVTSPVNLLKMLSHFDGNPLQRDFLLKNTIRQMSERYGPGQIPFGWRGSDGNEKWWRTGTLAGVYALMMRENPKISWAVVVNTSNEDTGYFHSEFSHLMSSFLDENTNWPETDLFTHYF